MSMPDYDTENHSVISFGPFRITRARRLVERDGEIVRLGSRAFDVLAYLLEHAGQVVSHRALLEAVWPGIYVEEGNLRFQMATLRKALGQGDATYIINVPGRGYCFTAPISKQADAKYSPPPSKSAVVEPVSPATPPANADLSAANVLAYPAPRPVLGIVRGTVSVIPPGREGKSDGGIRTKLDDLALAIQLAAAQARAFGIDKVSGLLEEHWFSGWPDQGETPSKHQTLYAMLDWSYRLLPETHQRVFRYISVFAGQFDLPAASAVVDRDMEAGSILAELASRSLLSLNQSRFGTRYRLLGATRMFARDMLAEAGEVREARRRHALFFTQAVQNLKAGDLGQSLPKVLTYEMDDVLDGVIYGLSSEPNCLPCTVLAS
jgi:DNA-binding winged helix-turn-helix (wHTH) protein